MEGLLQAVRTFVSYRLRECATYALVRENKIVCVRRNFPRKLQDAFLVIAATSVPSVNEAVYRAADARGLLCNAWMTSRTAISITAPLCSAAICKLPSRQTERACLAQRLRKSSKRSSVSIRKLD